jgi:dynein assembly factor 5
MEKLVNYKMMRTNHMFKLFKELKSNCDSWNDNSLEPIVFGKLIKDCGLAEEILNIVIEILKICLNPSKDVQMRSRFLLLIPEIFLSSKKEEEVQTEQSLRYLSSCIEAIINDMIMPNVQWKAGRSAGAVRMTAIASLALLIQTNTVQHIQVKLTTIENLIKVMITVLDDDNKSTRLYVCKIYLVILKYFGSILHKDHLHKLYPEFIKRLDDQSEEIRFEILNVFWVYMESLKKDYDKILYQAHLQMIFENILLYLDDSNPDVQLKVFSNKNFYSLLFY